MNVRGRFLTAQGRHAPDRSENNQWHGSVPKYPHEMALAFEREMKFVPQRRKCWRVFEDNGPIRCEIGLEIRKERERAECGATANDCRTPKLTLDDEDDECGGGYRRDQRQSVHHDLHARHRCDYCRQGVSRCRLSDGRNSEAKSQEQ